MPTRPCRTANCYKRCGDPTTATKLNTYVSLSRAFERRLSRIPITLSTSLPNPGSATGSMGFRRRNDSLAPCVRTVRIELAKRVPLPWFHISLSLAIIAGISVICYRVFGVNATTAGFVYLVAILAIAAAWGLIQALVASAAAMLCFGYFFLPPIGRFSIADPANWVALAAFVVTALVGSHLSDRARKEAQDAKNRQREGELLYALSRALLLIEAPGSFGLQTARSLAEIFECRSVALRDAATGEIFNGGQETLAEIEPKLIEAASGGENYHDSELFVAAIRLGKRPIGSLALRGISLSDEALQALLNLVAIALERVRTQEAANRAEAARQSEEFKSTLLDAITHEFKTPLTSIKVASTSILTDIPALHSQVRELTLIIDDEANRLNVLVTDAVRMAQIDASKIHLERQPVAVTEFIDRVLESFGPRLEERKLDLSLAENLPLVSADPDLASMALRQVIHNSLKYASPATRLQLAAETDRTGVTIRVRDQGPGIPEHERERI